MLSRERAADAAGRPPGEGSIVEPVPERIIATIRTETASSLPDDAMRADDVRGLCSGVRTQNQPILEADADTTARKTSRAESRGQRLTAADPSARLSFGDRQEQRPCPWLFVLRPS